MHISLLRVIAKNFPAYGECFPYTTSTTSLTVDGNILPHLVNKILPELTGAAL
jgi:hypothetical protein